MTERLLFSPWFVFYCFPSLVALRESSGSHYHDDRSGLGEVGSEDG